MNDSTPRQGDERPHRDARAPEDHSEEPGAGGGSASAGDVTTPFSPHQEDDSPLGDTDQHSDA